ncbi:hypothetical protein VKT23_015419 [Stygiomarasmius scandens]|uniref:Methyltransferase type 12 domain-containing protein n=1 Tax=Marasmiellus scandens TaxID=2682957 RepID=A0ABR1J243_9AGAR
MADKQTTNVDAVSNNGHGHDYAAANKEFFDKSPEYSESYDTNPVYIDTTSKIATEMLKTHPFNKETTRMMDFACGTGLVSRVFIPHVKSLVGVDISQGMLTQFDKRANELEANDKAKVRSVCIEIKGEEGELEKLGGEKFGVITCSMAFHHLSDLPKMTRILVSFLNPGGALMIADGQHGDSILGHAHGHGHDHGHGHHQQEHGHGHHQHEHGHGQHDHDHDPAEPIKPDSEAFEQVVAHQHGFTDGAVKELFEGAGLVDFTIRKEVARAKLWKDSDTEIVVFVAKGVKPLDA